MDTAYITWIGSAGDDTLIATSTLSTLSGPGFSFIHTRPGSIVTLTTDGGSGHDTAYVYDSNSGDTLTAQPRFVALDEPQPPFNFQLRRLTATNFATIRALASGTITANLVDSAGADVFVAAPTYSYLASDDFLLFVSGFARVSAVSSGGGDVAYFLESPGDDLFRGPPTSAYLAGTNFFNVANAFRTVVAYSGAGGSDLADLYDSAGDDVFTGQGNTGVLSGPGFSL